MATTIKEVVEAFDLLYHSLRRKDFSKSYRLHEWSEAELLPLVRCFLLGYFGKALSPELAAKLPGSLTGHGRIDFLVDDVAVEFAVRRPSAARAVLSSTVNASEVKKLMKFDGKALLVLFDFSKIPFDDEDIERFRDWPSLGKGNHKKSAFNIAYFHRTGTAPAAYDIFLKNIRVN